MKFQLYRHGDNAAQDSPHKDAVFDEELNWWTIDIKDLDHLLEVIGDECVVVFNAKPDPPVIEFAVPVEDEDE